MMHTGMITFAEIDDLGQEARERIALPCCPSLDALTTFATGLKAYSNAGLFKLSYLQTEYLNETPDTADAFDVVHWKGICTLKEQGKTGREAFVRVPICAPKKSCFEAVTGGYVMRADVGTAIATLYSALTGKTYTFYRGYIVG